MRALSGAGFGIRRRGGAKKPISGDSAPNATQEMLITNSPSITFSTPVMPPTESTSHIWLTSTADNSSDATPSASRTSRTRGSLLIGRGGS